MHRPDLHGTQTDLVWLDFGPQIAAALFAVLALYTLALLATTMHRRLPGLGWLGGRTLRQDLTLGLALLAVVPAAALALVLASEAADQRQDRAAGLLHETAYGVAAQLDQYFEKHRSGIASLAASVSRAGRFDARSLSEWLTSHHAIYSDYLTMLAADAHGDVVVASALVEGKPERIATRSLSVADRDYFTVPMHDGGVYVSNVFRGRGLGNDAIVAVASAIGDPAGERWGIVEGSLDLSVLARFPSTLRATDHHTDLLVLDTDDRVIFATDSLYPTLSRIPAGVASDLHHLDPERVPGQRARRSLDGRFLLATRSTGMGWRVVTRMPLHPLYATVIADFRVTVIWLLATVMAAVLLSIALARRVSMPLGSLASAVRSLNLDGAEASIDAPRGAAGEIRELFGHLAMVSQRMRNSYRQLSAAGEAGKHYREQLEQTLSRRDAEIERRTRELEETNSKLRTLSHADPLTGLPNRRRLLDTLDRVWRHGMREKAPVSIAIMDLDHFKAYNDSYGHQGGDQCLVRVGEALSSVVGRPLDLAARCGGEEFMLILGNTDLDAALAIAERTRRLIEDLAIPHKGSSTDTIVTLSCGVACTIPQRGADYDELIRDADRALYHAKERGRNQVGWAGASGPAIYDAHAGADLDVTLKR